jgi:catechol 2,3-dioxygenase-like lactoylglutathione lyase family enzyme
MTVLAQATAIVFMPSADVAGTTPFYRDLLGLPLIEEDVYGTVFDLGGGATMRLTAIGDHVAGPHPLLGWTVPDIGASVDGLAAGGVACEIYEGFGQDEKGIWTSPDGATKIAWFKDPEGNVLSVAQDG